MYGDIKIYLLYGRLGLVFSSFGWAYPLEKESIFKSMTILNEENM